MLRVPSWKAPIPPAQVISYAQGDNRFVVLVVQDNGVTRAQAKRAAREKAAQVTLDNGYRYFTVESEREVQVTKTDRPPGADMPTNLYQEQIIEGGFGRETLERQGPYPTETYPAIRLTFACYQDKPFFRNAIDAKALLNGSN